jgi:hypothetical protein
MLGAEIDDTDDERFQHVLPLTKRIRSGPRMARVWTFRETTENRVQYVPVNRRKDT